MSTVNEAPFPFTTLSELPPAAPPEAVRGRIADLPADQRPREKFAAQGPESISDAELLALFFGTGTVGHSAIDLGRNLLRDYGSLAQLARHSFHEFQAIKGIGPAKALHLAAAFELGKRVARQEYSDCELDDPGVIYNLLGPEMNALDRESIRVILLNSKCRLIKIEEIASGTVSECLARPVEIIRPAIIHQAYGFILVHNHPSGDSQPSEQDRRLTRLLIDTCRALQLKILDHIVIGRPGPAGQPAWFSFREAGMV